MAASAYIPFVLKSRTAEGLRKEIIKFQNLQGGKCPIGAIYYAAGWHYCWIWPVESLGVAI